MADTPPPTETQVAPQATSSPKRPRRRLPGIIGALLILLVIALPVSNLFIAPPSGTALTLAAAHTPEFKEAAQLLEANCLDCHSSTARLPLYARLPGARSVVERDMARGTRYMDMLSDVILPDDNQVSEVALAKLEYVLAHDSMPPTPYAMMHWNRGLDSTERQVLLDAIHNIRAAHYATNTSSVEARRDVLQPVPPAEGLDSDKVALGDKLFHDVRLSGDNTLSCASCHGLDKGGTDQRKTSLGINGAVGPINAPTVFNAVFARKQFWDGRAADLAEQAAGPVNNPIEMGATWEMVLPRLQADAEFVQAFTAAYPEGISAESVCHAIAEFERSLVTPNARFDRYLAGQTDALAADELAGLHLFRDNGCANCHVGTALGGQSFEYMGRAADYFAARSDDLTPADDGRYGVTHQDRDRHCFKVPTLRNIALTYPYFHDGTQADLVDAVTTMAKCQAYYPFTPRQAEQVVQFLNTLTGEFRGEMLQ